MAALLREGLAEHATRVLGSKSSVLGHAFGRDTLAALRLRAKRSPTLAYRLATVGIWEETANL